MNKHVQNTAIDWPDWWCGKGKHFLEGFPYVGSQCKVVKHVARLLKLRNSSSFDSAWLAAGYTLEKRYSVLHVVASMYLIISRYVKWPNYYFYPEDRCSLLLGVIPGVGYDAEDLIEEIRVFFGLSGMKDGDFRYDETVLDGKFVDIINLIDLSGWCDGI